MTEILILNTNEAYFADITSATNVLATGGYHVNDDLALISGYDSAEHSLAITTNADTIKALRMLAADGGYAIWPIYTQEVDEPEEFAGYLTVENADGKVVQVVSGAITDTGTTAAEVVAIVLSYFTAGAADTFDDADDLVDAITTAKGKLAIAIAE